MYVMQNTWMLFITDFIDFFPPWNKCFYIIKIKDEQFNSWMENICRGKNKFYNIHNEIE